MTRLSLWLHATSAGFPSPTHISLFQADRQRNMEAPNTLKDALVPCPPDLFALFFANRTPC